MPHRSTCVPGLPRWDTPVAGDVTFGQATAYLVTLRGAGHTSTRRAYGRILRRIMTEFGNDAAPDIGP